MSRRRRPAPWLRRPVKRRPLELVQACLSVTGDVARFRVSRNLKTANATYGAHWSMKHRVSQQWQWDLARALSVAYNVSLVAGEPVRPVYANVARRAPRRGYRVVVRRFAPSRRNFIRDDDNLRFATKPLNDALVRLGFIYEDRREWLEQPMPTQYVSADGRYWTEIVITPWWLGSLGPALTDDHVHEHDLFTKETP